MAFKLTDQQGGYLSESTVYRILKQRKLLAALNPILVAVLTEFKDKA
ncbi:hypothetical protein [Myroides sp. LJL119]